MHSVEAHQVDVGREGLGGRRSRRAGIDEDHDTTLTRIAEPVGAQALDQVGRRIVQGRRPDMWLAAKGGKQDEDLCEAAIEGGRLGWPANRGQSIPEWLRVNGIVQEDGVAQVAYVSSRGRMHTSFIEDQAAHRRRIDGRHALQTIAVRKTGTVGRDVPWPDTAYKEESMHHRAIAGLAAAAILVLAACSSSAATSAPSSVASAAPTVEASSAPSAAAGGGAACSESTDAGQVAVAIKNFAFGPADVQAKVGQIIAFSNGDSAPHTATLDDGTCTTGTISPGSADGLVFTAAGTYPFHCKIHTNMKGTITVS
jgi:plastocyanin